MADAEQVPRRVEPWFAPSAWSRADVVALLIWSGAVVLLFWDAVTLRGAFFYFDITEINFPYRAFFAHELRAGRFSRWCPWLYCGMPLYSESQAGYLHPLKYLLYPWMDTWKAFNFDTVGSIWLVGLGTYGWLRRHVRPAAALTGAALFGLGGFTWAHIVHTSMLNALVSVPFVVWGLEWSWETRRWRGVVLGAVALACQVFAGHLQDFLLTSGIVACYGLYRWATGLGARARRLELGMAAGLVALGVLLAAVQWIPSKELLDRSPRAGGLSYPDLTYASWSPELLPTLVAREAYGTRARDTDWMNGYYPYHEMNTYLGILGLVLAWLGAGGPGQRDRWTNFWVLLAAVGGILMLGKFTFLYDKANLIPVLGSSREPVRFHLWVSLAVAALAAVAVERLARPVAVRLRGAFFLAVGLIVVSIPVMVYLYTPAWTDAKRWDDPYHLQRFRWLGQELKGALTRDAALIVVGFIVLFWASRSRLPRRRAALAWVFPLLVLVDLMASAWHEAPTVSPSYWTSPPETVRQLKADPGFIRMFGKGDKSSGEPGYASERINFLKARDPLDWSLPAVWGLACSKGETPMIPQRLHDYFDAAAYGAGRFDIESVSHMVVGRRLRPVFLPSTRAGAAFIHKNPNVLPRARLVGRPVYVENASVGVAALKHLGAESRKRLIVEDPTRPLDPLADVSGAARIVNDLPERVVIETESNGPAYLVLADTFDPGWSATIDGQAASIYPAYVAFRAVFLPKGSHTVVFTYRPAGFDLGLGISILGIVLAIVLWFRQRTEGSPLGDHLVLGSSTRFREILFLTLAAIVLLSVVRIGPGPRFSVQRRWATSFHRFTWGAGIAAMKENRQ
ncbi:MAG: YfhO family protein [Isosphaeraceae bacterium]